MNDDFGIVKQFGRPECLDRLELLDNLEGSDLSNWAKLPNRPESGELLDNFEWAEYAKHPG